MCYHKGYSESKLEGLVKSEVYPPAVKCAVTYSSPRDFERPSLESFNMKIKGTNKRNVSFPIKVYSANGESMNMCYMSCGMFVFTGRISCFWCSCCTYQ